MRYLFLLAIAPVLFLLSYIKKKDPNPEPKELLRKIFIFGCLTVIPVLIFEGFYDGLFIPEGTETESFTDVFFGVAFIEEFFKWIVIYAICFKSKHFDETYDAIVYSAYSSLAFACVENVLYVLMYGGVVGILRALTAVPGHLCHGIIMGYFVGKARHAKAQNKSAFFLLACSLFLATLTHCIYDYLLEIESILLWLPFFVTLIITCVVIVNQSAKNNLAISDNLTTPDQTPAPQPTITPVATTSQPAVTPEPAPTQSTTTSYDWGDITQQPQANAQSTTSYDWGTPTDQQSNPTNQTPSQI